MALLFVAYILNGLLMILLPIGVGYFLIRRFELEGRLFWIAAGTFILSQVGQMPFNWAVSTYGLQPLHLPAFWQGILYAVLMGASAGLWQEFARYFMCRWWARDARSWANGLLLGVGFAAVTSISLGFIALQNFGQLVSLRTTDLATVLPLGQVAAARAQIDAYWSIPWYSAFLGATEHLLAIPVHLALSIMVLQAFLRNKFRWIWGAVAFHAAWEGALVYAAQSGLSSWGVEGIAAVFALAGLGVIIALYQPAPRRVPSPVQDTVHPPKTVEETIEKYKH